MELIKKYTIDYQTIEDWVVSAVGGSAYYWALFWDMSELGGFREGHSLSVRIADACWNHGVEIPIHDVKDIDEDTNQLSDDATPLGFINRENLERGCRLYTENGGDMSEHAYYDANDADTWFQYVVLGEIVYS